MILAPVFVATLHTIPLALLTHAMAVEQLIMSSLLLLSISLLPRICLTLWSIAGEEKVVLVPLLHCIFAMQMMIFIYTCCCP